MPRKNVLSGWFFILRSSGPTCPYSTTLHFPCAKSRLVPPFRGRVTRPPSARASTSQRAGKAQRRRVVQRTAATARAPRALVCEPKVLLLDEPLSNLDAKLRGEMRLELRELHKRIRVTTLYVTHDQIEALSMSNRVAVVNAGRIAHSIIRAQSTNNRTVVSWPHLLGSTKHDNRRTLARKPGLDLGNRETAIGTFQCAQKYRRARRREVPLTIPARLCGCARRTEKGN